ncbi:MAG: MarR family transcriptional regulator [Kofleriaceae bacterium]|nr:MarR family transcriptional regulator [Kofleriaceae bacterium]
MQEAHDFGILLGLAYQAFVGHLHRDLAKHGFTAIGPTVGYVLRAIAEGPINQRQLSKRLGITDQGTAKIVDEMEREKLVRRVADPDDARARRLELGPRGEELLRAARRFHARFERELAKKMGTSVEATRSVLEHIVASDPDETGRGRIRPM